MNLAMTEIIATRELSIIRDDGTSQSVEIMLGKPSQFPDCADYYIPFRIIGIGSERVLYAAGVDGFQALQLVMIMIGATLAALSESLGGSLKWDGKEGGALGFPESPG
jgi:uncharacterized protein DUF6968